MATALERRAAEAYLQATKGLILRTGSILSTAFAGLGAWNEPDIPRYAETALPLLEGAADASAALTASYLTGLTGQPIQTAQNIPRSVDAVDPFIRLWTGLKNGEPFATALESATERARSGATAAAMDGQSTTSRSVAAQRWRRVPNGTTCSYCMVTSTKLYNSEQAARNVGHRNKGLLTCDCSIVPVVGDSDALAERNRDTLRAYYDAQRDEEPAYYDADTLDTAERPDSRPRNGATDTRNGSEQ